MQGYEPFVSYEGLEQLHRFIFIMAVTHVSYSCLTMLLAIVKVLYLDVEHWYLMRNFKIITNVTSCNSLIYDKSDSQMESLGR